MVVQEIFGVNRHMRRVCDDFAKADYAVICPALFDRTERGVELGYAPADVARGRELRGTIDAGKTVLDIRAAAAALPGAAKRGIVGYCWGGTVAWHGATRTSDFAAACGWYGGGIAEARDERPNCPVQLHFGETDASIPLADVELIPPPSRGWRSSSMPVPAMASAARSAAATCRPTPPGRRSGPWPSSPGTWAEGSGRDRPRNRPVPDALICG